MHTSNIRAPQQDQHHAPSLTDADFLMGPRKMGIMSTFAKGLEWASGLVTSRGIESAILSPGERVAYERSRLCSLSFLPVEFRNEASRLSNDYLAKEVIKRALRLASNDNSGSIRKHVVYTDKLIHDLRNSSFLAVSRCTSQFTFRLISKDSILESLIKAPLAPVLSHFIRDRDTYKTTPTGDLPGSPHFENDHYLGPSIRELTEKVVTLTINGTILSDAFKSINVSLDGAELLRFSKQYSDVWQFFETRHWRNMVALSEHIQELLPGIDEQELGSFVNTFYKSRYPIEDLTHYRERLKVKIESRRKNQNNLYESTPSSNSTTLPHGTEKCSPSARDLQPVIEQQLTTRNSFGLTPQEIFRYSRNLAKLAHRLGMTDSSTISELLEQEYHPESVSRELRLQLRPPSRPTSTQGEQMLHEEVVSQPLPISAPAPFISHYLDENGRDLIAQWLEVQSKEIVTLVQEKLDLIRQGARSKSITSIRHDKTFGLQECRILCHNAALRVYFLPKQRETGEIKVLLIGDKREQISDIDEAMKRAAYVRAKAR